MPHLIVFDLDGTLVDSRRDLAESANELLESYGATSLSVEHVTSLVGEGAKVLVERVLAASAVKRSLPEALEQFLAIYERRLANHTHTYPGVREMLDVVKGHAPLAVLTNKPGYHTILLLHALGLSPYFSQVIGGDSAFPRKPDPSSLQHLMTAFGVEPGGTVMVGDSIVDVETARRAKSTLCFAAYGFVQGAVGVDLPAGTLVAQTPGDLKPLLLGFLGG